MPASIFVTGTDTDAGKTWVTVAMIKLLREAGHSVAAFKPVCTGVSEQDGADVETLAAATGQRWDDVCPQSFRTPISPPSAAQAEGRMVDAAKINTAFSLHASSDSDFLVVEGAGGLLCPVTDSLVMADLAEAWDLPILIVAGLKLGAINHTLLTIDAAVSRGLSYRVVLSEPAKSDPVVHAATVREIADRVGERIVSTVPYGHRLLQFDPMQPTMPSEVPITATEVADWCHGDPSR